MICETQIFCIRRKHLHGERIFLASILTALLLFASPCDAQSERKLIREGNELYKEKKFAEAEANYKKSLSTNNK